MLNLLNMQTWCDVLCSGATVSLVSAASHWVHFDEKLFRCRLSQGGVEGEWKRFLSRGWHATPHTGNAPTRARVESRQNRAKHWHISEAMRAFSGLSAECQMFPRQAWFECLKAIRKCPECAMRFQSLIDAETLEAVAESIRQHVWSGDWWLRQCDVFFTHEHIKRQFRDGR